MVISNGKLPIILRKKLYMKANLRVSYSEIDPVFQRHICEE
jgi:hypothetical protein